jgi:DNA-binding transcriptional LysR family regulator
VDVVPETTDAHYQALLEDRLDVAIVSNSDRESDLAEFSLFSDELYAVMNTSHPLAKEPFSLPRQFSAETLVLYTGSRHAVVDEVRPPAGLRRTWSAVVNTRCKPQHAASLIDCVRAVGDSIRQPEWRKNLQGAVRS